MAAEAGAVPGRRQKRRGAQKRQRERGGVLVHGRDVVDWPDGLHKAGCGRKRALSGEEGGFGGNKCLEVLMVVLLSSFG